MTKVFHIHSIQATKATRRTIASTTVAPRHSSVEKVLLRVGKNLGEHRRAKGMSNSSLSRASGVSRSMVSRIERGAVSASLSTIARLADALGVDVEQFLAVSNPTD